jgi:hypothetical protein
MMPSPCVAMCRQVSPCARRRGHPSGPWRSDSAPRRCPLSHYAEREQGQMPAAWIGGGRGAVVIEPWALQHPARLCPTLAADDIRDVFMRSGATKGPCRADRHRSKHHHHSGPPCRTGSSSTAAAASPWRVWPARLHGGPLSSCGTRVPNSDPLPWNGRYDALRYDTV